MSRLKRSCNPGGWNSYPHSFIQRLSLDNCKQERNLETNYKIALQMPLILSFPFLIKIRIIFILRRQRERTYKQFRSSAKKKAGELFLFLNLLSHQCRAPCSSQFWSAQSKQRQHSQHEHRTACTWPIQKLRASSPSSPNSAVKDIGWNGLLLAAISGVMTMMVVTNICPTLLVSGHRTLIPIAVTVGSCTVLQQRPDSQLTCPKSCGQKMLEPGTWDLRQGIVRL